MMHTGERIKGGDMPDDLIAKVDGLMDQFMDVVEDIVEDRKLLRGVARSQNPSSIVVVLEKKNLYVLAQHHAGSLSTMYTYHPDRHISPEKAMSSARWEFKFEDPLMLVFPNNVLDQTEKDRYDALRVIAISHVESEIQRALSLMSLMQIRPLFGHASYIVDDRLACVLVPATEGSSQVYDDAIKPVLESGGLTVHRAQVFGHDEKKLREVWLNICRARIVVADLTGADPLVMYELGIAHTVGKEALVLYKRGERPEFPIALIRAGFIEYDEGEEGMKTLRADMSGILNEIFKLLDS